MKSEATVLKIDIVSFGSLISEVVVVVESEMFADVDAVAVSSRTVDYMKPVI